MNGIQSQGVNLLGLVAVGAFCVAGCAFGAAMAGKREAWAAPMMFAIGWAFIVLLWAWSQ